MSDPVEIHSSLNQRIWSGTDLQEEVSATLMRIAREFISSLNISAPIRDVTFTGSMANYSYTPTSDIDLHILLDFSDVDENVDLVRDLFGAKSVLWNEKHEIFVRGHEVELYVQDVNEPHHSQAVYSVLRDGWIVKPRPILSEPDLPAARRKARRMMSMIDQAMKSPNRIFHLERVKTKIKRMRQSGLERAGEMSPENLAFKILRRNGYLWKMRDTMTSDWDDLLSLESRKFERKSILI